MVLPAQHDLHLLDTHPHLGLLSLAAVARADGHDVTIYDPKRLVRSGALAYDETLYERVADDLLAGRPDAVGLTTLGCSFTFVVGVGRALERREPDLPLLLGGPHATMLARPILDRYPTFDVVVRHEAEETLPAVLASLETRDFVRVPGVTWRTPTGVAETAGSPRIDDLDTLPWLDYELYPMRELGLSLLRVEAGRGCPFACVFCSTATFFQRRYRLKSSRRLVAEMDALRDRYAPREFKLDHDLFTVDKRKVQEFCAAVEGHGHRWRVSARADCVDEELLEHMAAAGCIGLYLGVEAGSERMQKISAKRLDLDRVAPTLNACERLGIETTASFITGYPQETTEDQDATLNMLGDCFDRPAGSCIPQLHILTPEPGTLLFDQFGPSMLFDGYATPFNSWLLRPEDRQEVLAEPAVFASYYYYPTALPRYVHVGVVESVDLLRRLGRPVLVELIRSHGGKLAELIRGLIAASPKTGPPGARELEEYVRARLGDDDPVTSLVRYALLLRNPVPARRRRRPSAPTDRAANIHARYALPAGLRMLHNVHDCAEVMEWLSDGSRPVDAAHLPRTSYVLLPGEERPAQVALGVTALLDLVGAGCSPHDVAVSVGAIGDDLTEQWLADLVDAGLLIAADVDESVDAN
nr:radical SAM protein [Planosporangium thailandense]